MNRPVLALFSVLISLLLWMNFGQKEPLVQREIRVRLEASGLREGLLPEQFPTSTTVIAEGPRNLLNQVEAERLVVRADFRGVSPGVRAVALAVAGSFPPSLSVEPKFPTMRVQVSKSRTTRLPVTIETVGALPAGVVYRAATSEPREVEVLMPADAKNSVREVRATLDLSRLSEAVGWIEVNLVALDEDGRTIATAQIQPDAARIYPTLGGASPRALALLQPTWQGSVPVGYEVTQISVQPQQVEIKSESDVPTPALIRLEPISLAGRTETFEVEAHPIFPRDVRLAEPQAVRIRVEIAKVHG